jgi:hypothetical protein
MDGGTLGLIGGIAGTLLGVGGGVYGTWHEMRTEHALPNRQHFTFWPSTSNPWDRTDWLAMIHIWMGSLCWIGLLWAILLRAPYAVEYPLLMMLFFGFWFGHQRQVERIVEKVNRRLGGDPVMPARVSAAEGTAPQGPGQIETGRGPSETGPDAAQSG